MPCSHLTPPATPNQSPFVTFTPPGNQSGTQVMSWTNSSNVRVFQQSWTGPVVYSAMLAVCSMDGHGFEPWPKPLPMLADTSVRTWIEKAWLPCHTRGESDKQESMQEVHPSFQTQGRCHQGSKTGVSVAPWKGLMSSKNLKKDFIAAQLLKVLYNYLVVQLQWDWYQTGTVYPFTCSSHHLCYVAQLFCWAPPTVLGLLCVVPLICWWFATRYIRRSMPYESRTSRKLHEAWSYSWLGVANWKATTDRFCSH